MITLAALSRAQIARVQHLARPPSQAAFVGSIAEMSASSDPLQDFHIAKSGSDIVAFFKIDRDFARRLPHLPEGAHGLRGLLVGGQYQRLEYGRALFANLPHYVKALYPQTSELWLSVDAANAPAIALYMQQGWRAFGPRHRGRSGAEIVMRLPTKLA